MIGQVTFNNRVTSRKLLYAHGAPLYYFLCIFSDIQKEIFDINNFEFLISENKTLHRITCTMNLINAPHDATFVVL